MNATAQDFARVPAHEYRVLLDSLIRYRDKLCEIAKECSGCGGTGCVTVSAMRRGVEVERVVPCDDCVDIREVLE